MKPTVYPIFLIILLILPQTLWAQQASPARPQTSFSKGAAQITASYGYGQGDFLQSRNVISLRVGYYVVNRLSVGVVGSLMKEWFEDIHTNDLFSAGPFVRYQFLDRRISPFAELAYQYGRPSLGTKQGTWFTPGVNFRLFSQVRLEASYSLMFIPVREWIGQPQLGVTISLGKNRVNH